MPSFTQDKVIHKHTIHEKTFWEETKPTILFTSDSETTDQIQT